MIFNFHKNHKELVITIFVLYALLSIFIAVIPASEMVATNGPLPKEKNLSEAERRGQAVFIANGCVACHTQQVRDIEMDQTWGNRPSIPADYFYSKQRMNMWQQSPSLLGSERTGPDLTSVGERLPNETWQYIHLYNPRAMVPQSIMPAFPWLFEVKAEADSTKDVIVNIPEEFRKGIKGDIIATRDAKDLVAYLLSLKQVKIPQPQDFLPMPKSFVKEKRTAAAMPTSPESENAPTTIQADGKALFEGTCAVCHQSSGEGMKGAFPPLKGADVVNDDDATLHIKIILEGYNALPQYGAMPPFKDRFNDEEVAAIINYERTSWGNHGKTISPEEVTKIRASLE